MLLVEGLLRYPFQTFLLLAGAVGLCYVIYQRFFHPLATYPGPFLASLTDLWQVHQFLTLKQPYHLTDLHAKYGQIVRYGPDKISITDEAAVPILYQKGGKMFPKTEYYNAFGAAHPNVFGMRDQTLSLSRPDMPSEMLTTQQEHSIRRRHMSHSFSTSSVKDMEGYIDDNISILKGKITAYCMSGTPFDLKEALQYYVIDVLGELAFSQSFGAQEANDENHVPPVKEHSLLAAATGSWPSMTAWLKKWLPIVPSKALHKLFEGRAACAALASKCVTTRLQDLEKVRDDDNAASSQRKDILTSLILARHPDTGEKLTQTDLETEAFGFMFVVLPLHFLQSWWC
jgi:cytochrome P450